MKKKIKFSIQNMSIQDEEIREILIIYTSFSDDKRTFFTLHILYQFNVDLIIKFLGRDEEVYIQDQLESAIEDLKQTNQNKWKHAILIYTAFESHEESPSIVNLPPRKKIVERFGSFSVIQRLIVLGCVAVFFYSFFIAGQSVYKLGLVRIEHEKSADISLNSEIYDREVIETLYLPDYLPEGYKLLEQIGKAYENNLIKTIYTFNSYEIFLKQSIIRTNLDNENIMSTDVIINDNHGLYQEKENYKILVWTEHGYFYSLWCGSPNIAKYDLIKIAESLKETNY